MKKGNSWKVLLVLVVFVLFSGCVTGPYWDPVIKMPLPDEGYSGRDIVVSEFLYGEYKSSKTLSLDIEIIRESASIQDVSYRVANLLNERGIHAQAREGVESSELLEDQLLLRGAVIFTTRSGINAPSLIWVSTLIGFALPSPIPFTPGAYLDYRYELIAPDGRIIYASGPLNASVYWETRYAPNENKYCREATPVVLSAIGDKLAAELH